MKVADSAFAQLQKALSKFPEKGLIVPRECEGNDGSKHHENEGIYEGQLADILAWKQDFKEFFSVFQKAYADKVVVDRKHLSGHVRIVCATNPSWDYCEYCYQTERRQCPTGKLLFGEVGKTHFYTVAEAREKLKEVSRKDEPILERLEREEFHRNHVEPHLRSEKETSK